MSHARCLGIDVGTSSVKVVVADASGEILASAEAPLDVSRPAPLWSEQHPDDWWRATEQAVGVLAARGDTHGVAGIGLSGQMHGAVLLGDDERPLRPAILWNDGRSEDACRTLEERESRSRAITGNLAMPGFTAPKLVWVAEHEPEVFERTRSVVLPKDYVRLCMTGDQATDLSDASGTLWLDVGGRRWSAEMLDACGLRESSMPSLYEGTQATGRLRAGVASAWGLERVPVVAGAGDQAAGAAGAGVVEPGMASLALGTSGVLFVADDAFRPNPDRAMHAFCHCLPGLWHEMSVILSAASCLSWVTELTGAKDPGALLAEIERRDRPEKGLLFLPYLSGERTPHNDARATGSFLGLTHATDRAALGRAVLEGVSFAFADALDVLLEAGTRVEEISVIGGGSRSGLWGRILASVLGRPLAYREGAEVGPALGAARLALMQVTGESRATICRAPALTELVEPARDLSDHYAGLLADYRAAYPALKRRFTS